MYIIHYTYDIMYYTILYHYTHMTYIYIYIHMYNYSWMTNLPEAIPTRTQ